MEADLARLRADWEALLEPFAAEPATVANAFDDLVAAYSSQHRFYHNLAHVQQVLHSIGLLQDLAKDLSGVQLAGWFHDAVYDSKARDNEERSAVYAKEVLQRLNVPPETRERVGELILRTKTHEAMADDLDSCVLLDADLAVLGATAAEYAQYARAIRREYAWVPEDQYRSGRTQVLQRFMVRPRIYFTDAMFRKFEAAARENLTTEIATLAGSPYA